MIGTLTIQINCFVRDILRRCASGPTRMRVAHIFIAALAVAAGAAPARAACEVTSQEMSIGSADNEPWVIDPLAPIPVKAVTLRLTIAPNVKDCLVMARLANNEGAFAALEPFEWNNLVITPRVTAPGTSVFGDLTCGAVNKRAMTADRSVTFIWTLRAALKPDQLGAYSVPAPTSGDSGVGKVLRVRFRTLEQPAVVTSCGAGGGTGYGGAQGGDELDAFDWLWLKVPPVLKFALFTCGSNTTANFARFPTIANAGRTSLCMRVHGNIPANLAFSSGSGARIVNIDNAAAFARYRGEAAIGGNPRALVLGSGASGPPMIAFDPNSRGMNQIATLAFILEDADPAYLAGHYLDRLTISVQPSSAGAPNPGGY